MVSKTALFKSRLIIIKRFDHTPTITFHHKAETAVKITDWWRLVENVRTYLLPANDLF